MNAEWAGRVRSTIQVFSAVLCANLPKFFVRFEHNGGLGSAGRLPGLKRMCQRGVR